MLHFSFCATAGKVPSVLLYTLNANTVLSHGLPIGNVRFVCVAGQIYGLLRVPFCPSTFSSRRTVEKHSARSSTGATSWRLATRSSSVGYERFLVYRLCIYPTESFPSSEWRRRLGHRRREDGVAEIGGWARRGRGGVMFWGVRARRWNDEDVIELAIVRGSLVVGCPRF